MGGDFNYCTFVAFNLLTIRSCARHGFREISMKKLYTQRILLLSYLLLFFLSANAINMKVGETETLDIGNISHLQGCQWSISRPNDVIFTSAPQSYTTRVTIKAINSFSSTSPCIVQCKYYYLELDPTTGRYTYSRTGYKDWTIFVKADDNNTNDSDNSTISLSPSELNIEEGSGGRVYANGNYSGKITWSMDCKGKIASFSSTDNSKVWVYGESAGTTYLRATCSNGAMAVCKVNVKSKEETTDNNDLQIVDLGLSVNWATKNLGAKNSEQAGSYYAWGETSPKTYFTENNSKTYNWDITKYGIKDEGTYYNLPNDCDAAYLSLGKEWSIPTMPQLLELKNECSWISMYECDLNPSLDIDYSVDKFKGYKVIGKNGNSIFLPVTGVYENSTFNPYFVHQGVYVSKSGDERDPKKWYVGISFSSSTCGTIAMYRYLGAVIRPVTTNKPTSITNNYHYDTNDIITIYNLQGVRVKKMIRGNLYIINGKKVLYK